MKTLLAAEQRAFCPPHIEAKSGLMVHVTADTWQLLPTVQRGWKVDVSWIWDTNLPETDRSTILEVYTQYARTRAASTTAGIIASTKAFLSSGIPDLPALQGKWSGLRKHQKKRLNQFFATLVKLGRSEYQAHHEFTKANLDAETSNILHPQKGALDEKEYESLCAFLNLRLQSVDWDAERTIDFFESKDLFGRIRAAVSNKLLTMIVRRPIQISALKWCDLIPAGCSFEDESIDSAHEVGDIGNGQLQLRVFYAKRTGSDNWRDTPEQYPIPLSESMSDTLIRYKQLFNCGLGLLLERSNLQISHQQLLAITKYMPIFMSVDFYRLTFSRIGDVASLFTFYSRAFHCSGAAIASSMHWVPVESARTKECRATSNRLRHTVLTRGAQHGFDATTLATITGVTTPAARHYIDLDYESRRMIDDLYLGSRFLSEIFTAPLEEIPEDDECVTDQAFNPVGGLRSTQNCATCPSLMGRPVGCYGCNNFRPILEADHGRVLKYAESKLAANSTRLLSPKDKLSLEKLEKQISRIRMTIKACDEVLRSRRGIE
jgi:hypothetical protein